MAHTFINKSFVNNKYIDISLICLPLLCEVFLLQLSDNPVIGIVFLISCIITTTTVVFRLKHLMWRSQYCREYMAKNIARIISHMRDIF